VGNLISKDIFKFRPGTSLNVQQRFVREGDKVKKGQPLLKMEELIRAPFSGTISSVPANPGENVNPSDLVLHLENLENIYIRAILEQKTIFKVKKNQVVKLSFEEIPGKVFDGYVSKVYSDDPQLMIYIEPKTLPEKALPGMTVDMAIEVSAPRQALIVPVGAYKNGKILVKRALGKEEIPVKVGYIGPDFVEILSDKVSEKDMVKVWE
jgi:multidrug efflux pump subunit AcrA (membrane-fusion protein)